MIGRFIAKGELRDVYEAMNETARQPPAALWPATRAEALRRLDDFVPRAGRAYAATRNFDRGPADRSNVSVLAPYLRCRLVTEEEVLRAVLARHAPSTAQKFVAEVFWRTYWKGWLESRPRVWHDYLRALGSRFEELEGDAELAGAYESAVAGRTGIDAFDAWSRELVETGYLHNHARMWFASIWIFTLHLPWELGADFFMRHLLCGDQASNTLSWRWVAGLHTRGKTYLALRGNIRRYTDNRFEVASKLAPRADALAGPAYPTSGLPKVPLDVPQPEPALLVLHDDDAGGVTLLRDGLDIRATVALTVARGRSPRPLSASVTAFVRGALGDAIRQANDADAHAPIDASDVSAAVETLAERARAAGARLAIAPFAPVGPVRDALDAMREPLRVRGLRLAQIGRRYDALAWPHATRGFFALRERIPAILRELGITGGSA